MRATARDSGDDGGGDGGGGGGGGRERTHGTSSFTAGTLVSFFWPNWATDNQHSRSSKAAWKLRLIFLLHSARA